MKRFIAAACSGLSLMGCILGNRPASTGLGSLMPYAYEPLGVEFLVPNTFLDKGPTAPAADGFEAGRKLRNGNDAPYLFLEFYLADQEKDWLGRPAGAGADTGPVDSAEIMILDRSGKRYERGQDLMLSGTRHALRIIRVVLPANQRLLVYEISVDESGFGGNRDKVEAMIASIRIDPSKW